MMRKPSKCDCTTPIFRFIDGAWQCLNCQLHLAIYIERNDAERMRIMALIDAKEQVRR